MSTQVAGGTAGAPPILPPSLEGDETNKDSRTTAQTEMASTFAAAAAPSGAAAAPSDRALSDALKLATRWSLGMSRGPVGADHAAPSEPVRDGGRAMALAIGKQAARELGLDADDYTPDDMIALGRQAVIDHAYSDNLHLVLVGMARSEGGVNETAWASNDKDKIAEQVGAFVLSKFKDEIELYSALGEVAAAPPAVGRREVGNELLRQHGIDPAAGLAGGGDDVDDGHGSEAFTASPASDPYAGEHYFHRDRLDARDIRKMRMLDGTSPSDEQVERMVRELPDSLDAEFGRRFEAHKQIMSAALARMFAARLVLYARDNAIDLENATVTVSRAKTVYQRRGPNTLAQPFIRHGEIAAHGYVVAIRIGETEHRCFIAHSGKVQLLSPDGPIDAELRRQRGEMFDDAAIRAELDARGGPWTSHIVMETVGTGPYGIMREWLATGFGAEIEAGREAIRGQTLSECASDTLLNLIPFRAMIVALQKGDIGMAIAAGGLDILSLLPLVGAGFRLGAAGIRAGAPLLSVGIRLGGVTGRHGVTALRRLVGRAPVLRDSIKASLIGAGASAWGRLRPVDVQRVAAALRSTAPRLSSVLDRLVSRARGATIPNGLWRVRDAGTVSPAGQARDAIGPLPTVLAQDPQGRALALMPYGAGAGFYTQVSATSAERMGAVLVADREGWLYQTMPMHSLARYGVHTREAVQTLQGRRPGADGTTMWKGRHYVRLGGDYVEVVLDRAVSTAGRPIWRAVAPAGVLPDIVPHRLAYDAGRNLWRQAEAPALPGQAPFSLRPWAKGTGAGGVDARVSPDPAQLARIRDVLVAGMRNATPQQADVVRALLDRVASDPRGCAILRALCAHHDVLGQAPEIVLCDGADADQARPSLAHPVHGTIWNFDLQALRYGTTEAAVTELAAVYNNMTGLLQDEDPYAAMLAKGEPALDAKLEQAWAEWLAQDRDSAFRLEVRRGQHVSVSTPRTLAVAYVRRTLQEMRCYGGLNKHAMLALLNNAGSMYEVKVDLSGRDLDSVPPLPGDVQSLTLSHNPIRDWSNLPRGLAVLHAEGVGMVAAPAFPPGLLELDLSGNVLDVASVALPPTLRRLAIGRGGLTSLPVLPGTLEQLLVYQNELQALPADLPAGLVWLDASGNNLTDLPLHLPACLKTLRVGSNRISQLPAALPGGLVELDVYGNQLSSLPELPPTLRSLDVSLNLLEALPSNLPPGLTAIEARRNRLRRLPARLPSSLSLIDLQRNQIDELPADIGRLESCVIHLDGNPLTSRHIPGIPPDRLGPRVFFPVTVVVHATPAPDHLAVAAGRWLDGQPEKVLSRWAAIGKAVGNQPEAVAFSQFLDRLSSTVSYQDEAFRAQVADLLVELAKPERQPLLEDALGICQGATDTCEDRVISTWNDLHTLLRNDDIQRGLYDERIGDVVDFARQMFRINALTEIARAKTSTLTVADPVEVYLAYLVRLRGSLALTTVAPSMRFYDISGLTYNDLVQATRTVRRREREEFDKFLVLDYEPWRSLLKRKDPQAYAAAEAEMHALLETRFESRVQEALARLALDPADTAALADARKDIGPAIMREIQYEVLAPLTDALRP